MESSFQRLDALLEHMKAKRKNKYARSHKPSDREKPMTNAEISN